MIVSFFLLLGTISTAHAQEKLPQKAEPTIFRQAGDYSEKYDVLTIAVLRGVKDREQYDEFIEAVGTKLTEKGISYKFFQEFNEMPGTVFVYFIENDLNGSFNVEEFAAVLPHAVQRYKDQYPN
ncbi:hypothetical protein [Reichenbachiella sp.]|uniref:hypothetical protein n=1 Tax=Reichenbachiella sp. TaxID=2184521 RepID=UPI0032983133